ncbi:MAG TPA: Fur family transcriptional regulator [Candidatus Baltobacteraceae bacterium]|jgi:Fur family ferric uptake transcriptional regulator
MTKNHRLVLEVVRERGCGTHLSMNEVHAFARERQPRIGFTTVYRALARLRDEKLISEIRLPGAEAAYFEPAGPSHAHFRCSSCGSVSDVAYALPPGATDDIARRDGVDIRDIHLSFHGTCRDCR